MTRQFTLAILCLFLLLRPENSWADKFYRVVVFGDKVTAGKHAQRDDVFHAQLKRRLREVGYDRVDVVNLSKPDATVASATQDVELVRFEQPDVVIIMLGMNDISRRVLPESTQSSLTHIVKGLKPLNAYIILVGMVPPASMGEQYVHQMQVAYQAVATEQQVAFYADALAGVRDNPSRTMADGVSPNAVGIKIMVEHLLPLVDTGLRWRYELSRWEQAN